MCVSRAYAVACALMLVGASAFVAGPTLLPRVKGGGLPATAGATRRPGSLAMVRAREYEVGECPAGAITYLGSRNG